ncbi:HAD family hydrolase [Lachnospiraceae bacterium]|jgi:phosphoglycolate phosphatase|nr:HAD family hydrolase [Lachnospiraceae bacterium]
MDKFEAVVFDLDGTLLDTIEDLTDSVNAALQQYSCPLKTVDQVRSYVGNGIRNLMIRCIGQGERHPEFENIYRAFLEHYKVNCRSKTKPYDGVVRILRTLSDEGRKLAIVSNKADFAVKDLNTYYFKEFQMVAIGERDGIARKPAPDSVFAALRELDVPAGKAVYVGDSDVDVETARNAGIPCISVLWGFREKDVMLKCGAKYFAEDADGLLAVLKELEQV